MVHLFALTFVFAVVLAVVTAVERRVARVKAAVARIEAHGGSVEYELQGPSWIWERYRRRVVNVVAVDRFWSSDNASDGNPFRIDSGELDRDPFSQTGHVDQLPPRELLSLLKNFRRLKRLDLDSVAMEDADMALLDSSWPLESLDLSRTRVTEKGLDTLSSFDKLRSLTIGGSTVGDAHLRGLRSLTQIVRLDLSGTRVTDDGLKYLTPLEDLEVLNLSHTSVRGTGLPHLAPLGRLRRLVLDKSSWSPNDVLRALAEAVGEKLDDELLVDCSQELHLQSMPAFPALRYVSATNSILDESSFVALARQEQLRDLLLSGSNVRDTWLRHLAGSKLEELSLSETDVSVDGLTLIVNIPTLTELRMERMSMSAEDLSAVGKAKGLKVLTLDHTPFGDQLVEAVCSLSNLEYLQFKNAGLRDPDVARLESLPRLETLDVTGNPVSCPTMYRVR